MILLMEEILHQLKFGPLFTGFYTSRSGAGFTNKDNKGLWG